VMSDDFGLELIEDEAPEQAVEPREVIHRSIDAVNLSAIAQDDEGTADARSVEDICSDTFVAAAPSLELPPIDLSRPGAKMVELCILADRSEVKFALAAYLDCHPEEIRIEHDESGKPRVLSHRVHFSISHAAGRTLLAIGPQRIGVDLDRTHRPHAQADGLMRYFTEAERNVLMAIQQPRRSWLIMQCWARKEAFAKATGLGLRIGLDTFGVFDENPAVAKLTGGRTFGWQVMDIPLTGGYAAALVGPVGFNVRWAGRLAA
jgi:hypothetical protein